MKFVSRFSSLLFVTPMFTSGKQRYYPQSQISDSEFYQQKFQTFHIFDWFHRDKRRCFLVSSVMKLEGKKKLSSFFIFGCFQRVLERLSLVVV